MKELKGLDEWITRDNRQEIPTKVWWVEGFETDIQGFEGFEEYDDALEFLIDYGDLTMKQYPNDYIYESEVE